MRGDGGDADERRRFERIMIVTLVAIVALGGAAYALLPSGTGTREAALQERRFAGRGVIINGGADVTMVPAPAIATPPAGIVPQPVPPGDTVQPVDDPEAHEAITTAFNRVFGAQFNREAKLASIDDPSGLDPLFDAVAAAFPQAAETAEVTIDRIVYNSPDDASVVYRVAYEGAAPFGRKVGQARRTPDGWKVTRATVCELFSFAGEPCVAPDPPG